MERFSASIKVASIIIVTLILMIPKSMIESTVGERHGRKNSAFHEAAAGWGGEQTLSGIVIYVPVEYQTTVERKKEIKNNGNLETETVKEIVKTVKYLHILPDAFSAKATILPEIRYRSIYEFVFYETESIISGKFVLKNPKDYDSGDGLIKWGEARIVMGLVSMEGISETVQVSFGGTNVVMEQGVFMKDIFESGLSAKVNIEYSDNKEIDFHYNLNLRGSGQFSMLPLGKSTEFELSSSWKDPSFSGSYIPVKSRVSDKGFEAMWKVLDLNRNYPQNWIGNDEYKNIINNSKFGLKLINPVDNYCKIHRAVKYLFLFITLTFTMFFLVETIQKKRIHPVQYLLVGAAISVFYILLLAVSEHINFDLAYLISALSITAMLWLYSSGVLKSRKFGLMTGAATAVLYAFLFILVKNQDYALLLGSIGLFLSLGIIMYATKNTDWYGIGAHDKTEKEEQV
jgi:inner membrane protein